MIEKITVVLVDDHDVVREGISAYLETTSEFMVVGQAASSQEALRLIGETVPDVVLVDLVMPDVDNAKTIEEIKKISPHSQVVVLTAFHDDIHIFPALRAGAIAYILKNVKMNELADVIRSAAQEEVTLHPIVAERVLRALRNEGAKNEISFTQLTERELEILKVIANAQTNKQIAERLGISEATVKCHVSNILSKLKLTDRTEAAVYAWRKGIVKREQ